jgi:hypothetical protein
LISKIRKIFNRKEHGQSLISDLQKAQVDFEAQMDQEGKESFEFQPGVRITFESWEGFELKFESLEDPRAKIEILSVKEENNKFFTTVRIPEGKLEVFIKKIQNYLDPSKENKGGKPKNLELVANIEKIKLSALENFWSDSESFPQDLEQKHFLEAWLRVGDNRDLIINRFREQARKANIFVSENPLKFPETTVFLIHASMNQLKQSVLILDCISEIRIYKDTPASFLEMEPLEEMEWIKDLQHQVESKTIDFDMLPTSPYDYYYGKGKLKHKGGQKL